MQHARGFIVGCANGWLRSPGRQSTPNSKLGKLFICKKKILSAYYIRVTKWLVTCLQSNSIGTNFVGFGSNLKQFYWYKRRGLWFRLRRPRAFQLSRGLFTGCILIGWLQVTQWGRGIPPFHGKPGPCQPQPRQPHIIKLISQLQKPTRKISDTWIIDTSKRETRYRLVKIHQTIRQPHNS